MVDADLRGLDAVAAGLLASAKAPSWHTLSSYERRWRVWEGFARHHEVGVLPANPEHLAAFVLARWRAQVGDAALSANLSAVLWFHTQLADDLSGTCDLAKRLLGILRRESERPSRTAAPVLSVGALNAMVRAPAPWGTQRFSAKVLRLMSGALPRQLGALRATDVTFGPNDGWVEFETPAIPQARTHRAMGVQRFRFSHGLTAMDCPVEAMRTLVDASDGGLLFPKGFPGSATIKGFTPATSPDGVPLRVTVRNRAMVRVGYQGALRVQELVRANVEDLEPAGPGYRLRLVDTKSSKRGASEFVLLRREDSPLDAVTAIEEWLAVRGDHDGALFCSIHHGSANSAPGAALSDGEVRETIGDMAVAVGLANTVSGYSLRRSWATHEYLRDPNRLSLISRHLRHASVDMSARYIDDLGLHLLDASDFLSNESVTASLGGVTERRRDLGFVATPMGELIAEVRARTETKSPKAASSQVSERSSWNVWKTWAEGHDLTPLPATAEDLVFFAAYRADSGIAATTLRAQLRVIRQEHENAGYDAADLITLADEIAQGLARSAPREAVKAPVLTPSEMLALAEWTKNQARSGREEDLRDHVMVTVTYAGALRVDDLYRARIELVDTLPYGLALRFTTSKENQAGRHPEAVLLLSSPDALDPVSAVADWRHATGITAGPLVPVLGHDVSLPMPKDSIPDRLRRLAVAAGIEPRLTGQSLRRSWATHAYDSGVDPVTISRHLRHRDLTTTLGYIAKLSPWRDNVAVAVMKHSQQRGSR